MIVLTSPMRADKQEVCRVILSRPHGRTCTMGLAPRWLPEEWKTLAVESHTTEEPVYDRPFPTQNRAPIRCVPFDGYWGFGIPATAGSRSSRRVVNLVFSLEFRSGGPSTAYDQFGGVSSDFLGFVMAGMSGPGLGITPHAGMPSSNTIKR